MLRGSKLALPDCLGIVLYPLPGPGLLVLVLGLALLGRHDPWAAERLAPLRHRALVETRRSVATWPRTLVTAALTVGLGASGLLWLADPAQPTWWPLPAWTWLPGGTWTGVGQVGSGLVGLGIVVWARATTAGSVRSSRSMRSGTSSA